MPTPEEQIEERLARIEARQDELQAELRWLLHNQAGLDSRLTRVEDSIVFRTLRAIGRVYQTRIAKKKAGASRGYPEWLRRAGMDSAPQVGLRRQPLIQVRVEVRNPVRALLDRAVSSVKAQTYGSWELSADIDLTAPLWAKEMFGSAASGAAEWVARLGESDFLSPVALEHFAAAVQEGSPDLVYSDGDVVDAQGAPLRPLFKPDWSPVLLRHVPYLGGLRMERAGLVGDPVRVVHIPRVLYHSGEMGEPAGISVPLSSSYRPLVSIAICTRTSSLLRRCLAGIRDRTDYAAKETIVIQHLGSTDAQQEKAVLAVIEEFGAKRVPFGESFNFSKMNNRGAREAEGEILLFLNDDVAPIGTDWLARMVSHLEDPAVGAVGAKLLYPSGAIQHAGIATWLIDGAGHPGRNLFRSENWPWLNFTREVSAVTGACMAVRRTDFEKLGGFDPVFPVNYNDVDLCLRLHDAGFAVVIDAQAVLQHDESQTRRPGTQYEERRLFYRRWAHVVGRVDPYYSPHLAQNNEDLSLR